MVLVIDWLLQYVKSWVKSWKKTIPYRILSVVRVGGVESIRCVAEEITNYVGYWIEKVPFSRYLIQWDYKPSFVTRGSGFFYFKMSKEEWMSKSSTRCRRLVIWFIYLTSRYFPSLNLNIPLVGRYLHLGVLPPPPITITIIITFQQPLASNSVHTFGCKFYKVMLIPIFHLLNPFTTLSGCLLLFLFMAHCMHAAAESNTLL